MTTSPMALWSFFRPQIRDLRALGFEVHAVSSPGPLLDALREDLEIPVHEVQMERQISPWSDIGALFRLWRLMRLIRPDIVHAHTPKAGLLGSVAARLAGVPADFYTINGLPLVTRTGWRRRLLAAAESVTCRLAGTVFCVGPSLRQTAIENGIASPDRLRVLGDGSCSGIDLERFSPAGADEERAARALFGCPEEATVLLYAGRFVRDKGLAELAAAWRGLRERFPELHLLLCGEFEEYDPVKPELLAPLRNDSRVHWSDGFLLDVRPAYAAADFCVLPSYREGLPTVPRECGAMGKPTVATRIPGCVDTVQDGVTGLLTEPGNAAALEESLAKLAGDPALRRRMGAAAHAFVAEHFSRERVTGLLAAEYRRALARRKTGADRVRRILDIAASGFGLLLTAPLMGLAALGVLITMGRPVLFRQERGGLDGRIFRLLKFRTMKDLRDGGGRLLPDAERTTAVGRALRATSIDELPQLWNVLRGDMSLVGPRPLLAAYLPRYSEREQRRHEVKPGITGWAQIHGRNAVSWQERFERDLWYVEHRSLRLDMAILWRTLVQLFRREGVRAAGEVSMPEFQGSGQGQAS